MTLDDLVQKFGNKGQISLALGMSYSRIANWFYKGYIPQITQYQIEVLTKGKLKADKV